MLSMKMLTKLTAATAFAVSLGLAANNSAHAAECPGADQEMKIILFDYDSTIIKADYHQDLKEWAIRARNKLIVCIVGGTDKKGDASYNQKLALQRAEAVADFLEKEGITRSVMDIRSTGEALGEKMANVEMKSKLARRVEISYGR